MLNDGVIQKSDFREGTARSVPKVAAIAAELKNHRGPNASQSLNNCLSFVICVRMILLLRFYLFRHKLKSKQQPHNKQSQTARGNHL